MTFIEVTGDLFEGGYAAIGHGVNCQGEMDAGIAKPFRERNPKMYDIYKALCDGGWMQPEKVFPYYTGDQWIMNIASQDMPGAKAWYLWADNGVHEALRICKLYGVPELAIPRIGCGIGGLDYKRMRPWWMNSAEMVPEVNLIVVTPGD